MSQKSLLHVKAMTVISSLLIVAGCGQSGNNSEISSLPMRPAPANLATMYRFDLLTPTGDNIFRQSLKWESIQVDNPSYPRKAQCARNVSKVMTMSGLRRYNAEGVGSLLKTVVDAGGKFVKLSKDKSSIIAKLNSVYGGKLPVGTVVGGCLYSDCFAGLTGQRHSAIVGDVTPDGVVLLHNNNWYRPENEGGVWKNFMVSKYFLSLGFVRQWMPVPWLKMTRDSSGKIVDIKPMLPAVDDLDPFQYYLSLAIPVEITRDAAAMGMRETVNGMTPNISSFMRNTVNMSDEFDVVLDDDGTPL